MMKSFKLIPASFKFSRQQCLEIQWFVLPLMFLLGIGLGWLTYYFIKSDTTTIQKIWEIASIYLIAIFCGALLSYQYIRLPRQELDGMSILSANVAHELRTPLLGLRGGIAGFKKYLPILINAYQLTQEQNLTQHRIRKAHLNNLIPTLDRMDSEINFANMIIDILLMNAGQKTIDARTFLPYSIASCINAALARYHFDSAEQEAKIHWSAEQDFQFLGSQLLFEHVVFNLLKNALHFIIKANKGEIFIWLEQTPQWNYLHFKDTGHGISKEILPNIFKRFYTTTLTGTGIGLAFCQNVMTEFNGAITCQSVAGEFTQFTLSFPIIPKTSSH